MMIRTLKTIHPQRNLVLLGCVVLPSLLGHGWFQSGSIVAALWAVKNLAEAYSWKKRIQEIRSAVEERIPGAEILDWERSFALREWRADHGVICHSFVCRLVQGEVVRCQAVTDARNLRVLCLPSA